MDNMPARKRTKGRSAGSSPSSSRTADRDDEEYQAKRKRNNASVKKTRAKSRKTADERKMRVDNLVTENERLQTALEEKKKHIETLKGLLIGTVDTADSEKMIQGILDEKSDEEND